MPNDTIAFKLHAVTRRTDGKHVEIDQDELIKSIQHGQDPVLCVMQVLDTPASSTFLQTTLGFNRLAVEDALSSNERPALHEYKTHLFLVAPFVVRGKSEERYVEASIFVGSHYILVVVMEQADTINRWIDRWHEREAIDDGNLAFQLHALLDSVVDDYFPVCDDIEEAVDELEDVVFENRMSVVADALLLKRRLLEIRRRITPLRDVINGLLRRDVLFIPREVQPFMQDVYDHTLRVAEMVDINRDILSGVLDAHLAMVSNNLNIAMRILTVMATFLMTASLIAGIYGMNFKYMPELEQRWGYPYCLGLMAILGVVEWAYFKKKGWF